MNRGNEHSDSGSPMALSLTRYDLILLGVPICYLGALLVGFTFDMPTTVSLGGGSILGAALVGDALFRNPPGSHDGPPSVEQG